MNWVNCWGMAHAPLSLLRFPEKARTFRLVINTPISGENIRIRLSNKYGRGDVQIGAVTAAVCDIRGTVSPDASFVDLTYDGKKDFTLFKGRRIYTDPVEFSVKTGEYICLNIYVKSGVLESGNSLNNCLLMFTDDDSSLAKEFKHSGRFRDTVIFKTVSMLGLHHPLPIPLFEDVQLDNKEGASSIVCFGDSITQQGYWTNEFEAIIRKNFPGKYSVINKAITGNRLLFDSKIFIVPGLFGEKALNRVDNDVFALDNVSHALVCMGVNDMIQPGSIVAPKSEFAAPQEYYDGIRELYGMFRKHGIKTLGMNYPPFGTSPDSTPAKNRIREIVNDWFYENQDICDRFLDIYGLIKCDDNPDNAPNEILGEDHVHPNSLGGKIMASSIPLDFFE